MKTNAGTKENPLPAVPYWRVPIAFADRQTGLLESKVSRDFLSLFMVGKNVEIM